MLQLSWLWTAAAHSYMESTLLIFSPLKKNENRRQQ